MGYHLAVPLACCALLALPHEAVPQSCERINTIIGRVVDSVTGEPLAGARIIVSDRSCNTAGPRPVQTDSSGQFRIQFRFDVARLEATAPDYTSRPGRTIYFDAERRIEVVALALRPHDADPEPVYTVDGLEVVATRTRRSPVLTAFDERVASGRGRYITRDEIESRMPGRVTDLLSTVPGLTLISSGTGNQREVVFSRHAAQSDRCAAQIFLNGRLINKAPPRSPRATTTGSPTMTIDDVAVPADLEGIEIYYGLSTIPPEFLNESARCGVIALWSRRGH
jgi:hypothetical protein